MGVFIELGFIFKAIERFLAHLVPSGTPDVLIPLIVVIELVRNFIRPITLSVRLAANIVAGHLLIRLVNGGRLSLVTAPIIVLSGMVLIVLEVSVAFNHTAKHVLHKGSAHLVLGRLGFAWAWS